MDFTKSKWLVNQLVGKTFILAKWVAPYSAVLFDKKGDAHPFPYNSDLSYKYAIASPHWKSISEPEALEMLRKVRDGSKND